ncbi:MAG: hypothetical protein JSS09_04515, partial [Verrucomicrobia bacterium]|nr:hypothetical protein [Verrucomicrobiota bacterium]
IGFGKAVTVEKIPADPDKTVFTKKAYSTTSARVTAVALFILAFPLTILLAGIGCVGVAFSKSHEQIFNSYIQFEAQKHVHVEGARGRSFNQTNPAAEVGNLYSTEIENNTFPQETNTPPPGIRDTVIFSRSERESIHGNGKLFSDSEIIENIDSSDTGNRKAISFNQTNPAAEVGNLQSTEIEKNTFPQERNTPPLGPCDTVIFSRSGRKSIHGNGELFSDSEIIEKLDIIERENIGLNTYIGSSIYCSYTKNRKAIIQQQATRGCTAATAAMLIKDNGKKPNLLALQSSYLGNNEKQVRDIQEAGLKAVINSANDLSELRNLIIQNDSCIVSVSGKLGGHVIVVDEVSEDLSKIRLRDPCHGWEITVSREAFFKEWHGGTAIQIVK